MDELFEIITLVQTKKISKVPIILYGKEYWAPLQKWIEDTMYKKYKTIKKEDLDIYHVVDSVDEAYDYIMKRTDFASPKQV